MAKLAPTPKKPRKKASTTPRPMGRPSVYKPQFCDEIVELRSKGYEVAEVALAFGVAKDTLYDWCRTNPDFSAAFARARDAAEAYFAKMVREGLANKHRGYEGQVALRYMSTRFRKAPTADPEDNWVENSSLTVNGTINVDGARDAIAQQLARTLAAPAAPQGDAGDPAETDGSAGGGPQV
jgi:transposase-like protein